MFYAPFVLLALSYGATPWELPVPRAGIGRTTLWASKSLFTVFRVPVMNLIHGLMAAIMLSRASVFGNIERRISHSNMFSTFLFAIALKSDFEGLEFLAAASPALLPYARWIALGTLTSMLVGLGLAIVGGRKVPLPWPELHLKMRDQDFAVWLIVVYIAIVVATLAVGHRLHS